MDKKGFVVSIDVITHDNKKFISLNDLLLSLYKMKSEGYDFLNTSDFAKSLEALAPKKD